MLIIKLPALTLTLTLFLTACGGGSSTSTPTTVSNITNNKLVVLNNMTPTGYVKDGVDMLGMKGANSTTTQQTEFLFPTALPYGQSTIIYLSDSQCDKYWDLNPIAASTLNLSPNTGVGTFMPCGKTVTCTGTIEKVNLSALGAGIMLFASRTCTAPI